MPPSIFGLGPNDEMSARVSVFKSVIIRVLAGVPPKRTRRAEGGDFSSGEISEAVVQLLMNGNELLSYLVFRASNPFLFKILSDPNFEKTRDGEPTGIRALDDDVILGRILSFLPSKDLASCLQVCVRVRWILGTPNFVAPLVGDENFGKFDFRDMGRGLKKSGGEYSSDSIADALSTAAKAVEKLKARAPEAFARAREFVGDVSSLKDTDRLVYAYAVECPDLPKRLKASEQALRSRKRMDEIRSACEEVVQAESELREALPTLALILTHVVALDKALRLPSDKRPRAFSAADDDNRLGASWKSLLTLTQVKSRFESKLNLLMMALALCMTHYGEIFDVEKLRVLKSATKSLRASSSNVPLSTMFMRMKRSLGEFDQAGYRATTKAAKLYHSFAMGSYVAAKAALEEAQASYSSALSMLFVSVADSMGSSSKSVELNALAELADSMADVCSTTVTHPLFVRDAAIANFALDARATGASVSRVANTRKAPKRKPSEKFNALRNSISVGLDPAKERVKRHNELSSKIASEMGGIEGKERRMDARNVLEGMLTSRAPSAAPRKRRDLSSDREEEEAPAPDVPVDIPPKKKQEESPEETPEQPTKKVRKRTLVEVTHDFKAVDGAHMQDVREGDVLVVLKRFGDGWIKGRNRRTGNEGFVPFPFVVERKTTVKPVGTDDGKRSKNWKCVPFPIPDWKRELVWNRVDYMYEYDDDVSEEIRKVFSRGTKIDSAKVAEKHAAGIQKRFSFENFDGTAHRHRSTAGRDFSQVPADKKKYLKHVLGDAPLKKRGAITTTTSESTRTATPTAAATPVEKLSYEALLDLKNRNVLGNMDRSSLEEYLTNESFQRVFETPREDFAKLAKWKRDAAKKKAKLW